MLWAKNKPNLSVVFTEESADQKLLEAIDKELTANKYQTFSNLCKQAIWQFLFESPATNTVDNSLSTSAIEKSISDLAQKFNLLEQQLAGKESAQIQEMGRQLVRLGQQLTQMQTDLDKKFIETVEILKTPPPPAASPSPLITTVPENQPVIPSPPPPVVPQSTPIPSPIKPFVPTSSVPAATQTPEDLPKQEVSENLPLEEEEDVDPVIKRLQGMMESF